MGAGERERSRSGRLHDAELLRNYSMKQATNDREMEFHTARVLLNEARARRRSPGFHATLLEWAANARKRAAAVPRELKQADLFMETMR